MAQQMDLTEFASLREAMLKDRYNQEEHIPETPEDIPELASVENLPIFVSQWLLLNCYCYCSCFTIVSILMHIHMDDK